MFIHQAEPAEANGGAPANAERLAASHWSWLDNAVLSFDS